MYVRKFLIYPCPHTSINTPIIITITHQSGLFVTVGKLISTTHNRPKFLIYFQLFHVGKETKKTWGRWSQKNPILFLEGYEPGIRQEKYRNL